MVQLLFIFHLCSAHTLDYSVRSRKRTWHKHIQRDREKEQFIANSLSDKIFIYILYFYQGVQFEIHWLAFKSAFVSSEFHFVCRFYRSWIGCFFSRLCSHRSITMQKCPQSMSSRSILCDRNVMKMYLFFVHCVYQFFGVHNLKKMLIRCESIRICCSVWFFSLYAMKEGKTANE